MTYRWITRIQLAAVCAFVGVGTLAAAEPRQTYVTTLLQDEPRVLPQENAAFFARNDRRVRFQLMQMGDSATMLAGTTLTVIDAEGQTTKLTADAQGIATLSNAKPGLHAVVASGPQGHVATPLALRERPEVPTPLDDTLVFNEPVDTVTLPLVGVDPHEVMRVASSFLPTPTNLVSAADIDNELITAGTVGPMHRYQVRLGAGGRLEGQVFSVMVPGIAAQSVAGTNVMIYRGSQLVARAISDQEGRFAVDNMLPGFHGLIAAGAGGYAAFAFETIHDAEFVKSPSTQTFVSTAGTTAAMVRMNQPLVGGGDTLPVLLIPQPLIPFVMDVIREGVAGGLLVDVAPGIAPVLGGGFAAGGFGGGGGGVGGGRGIGPLLGVAGLAAVAAALARDRDSRDVVIVPPASPAALGTQNSP
jgi:hypothetical protein